MEKKIPTSIRIDEAILEKVKKDAERDKRSVSKQIEFMIEKYYEIISLTQK